MDRNCFGLLHVTLRSSLMGTTNGDSKLDPYTIVSGDFNHWDIASDLEDFVDITETTAGPTKGGRAIDGTLTRAQQLINLEIPVLV